MRETMEKPGIQELIKEFPELFDSKNMCASDLPPGWYDVVKELCVQISAHIKTCPIINNPSNKSDDLEFRVAQVKEKHGTLRFYIDSSCDEIYELINQAEDKCKKTCSVCGKPGEITNRGSLVVCVCGECLEKIK